MMSVVDICRNFPKVSYGDVRVQERNLVFAQMEDGSGYSWNLQVIVNDVKYDMYVKFDKMTRKATEVVFDGNACFETVWEWVASW